MVITMAKLRMTHAWRMQAAWAKKKERLHDGNNNGQLRIANATSGGARKATGPIILLVHICNIEHKKG